MPFISHTFLGFQAPFFIDSNGVIQELRLETLQDHPLDPPILKNRRLFLLEVGVEIFARYAKIYNPKDFPPILSTRRKW